MQFNKLVDRDFLSSHPQLVTVQGFDHPVVARLFYYYGSASRSVRTTSGYPYDDLFLFEMRDSLSWARSPYEIGRSYTVTISAGLMDINGNVLHQPYLFAYMPEPFFRVVTFSPADRSTNVQRNARIGIAFNNPIDPDIYSRVHLTPPIPGRWKIDDQDSTILEFIYAGYPSFSTLYTMTVDGDAGDSRGHTMHAPAQSVYDDSVHGQVDLPRER